MKKYILVLAFVVAIINIAPSSFASAKSTSSVSELQSAINQLYEQIKSLQSKIVELQSQVELTKSTELKFTKTLKQGMSGNDVRALQEFLQELNFYKNKINGYFNLSTKKALIKFQKSYNLKQTGILDAKTRKVINELIAEKEKEEIADEDDDTPTASSTPSTLLKSSIPTSTTTSPASTTTTSTSAPQQSSAVSSAVQSSSVSQSYSAPQSSYSSPPSSSNTTNTTSVATITIASSTASSTSSVDDTSSPTTPRNFSMRADSPGSLLFSWSAPTNSTGITGYRLYVKNTQTNITKEYNYPISTTGAAGAASVGFGGFAEGVQYSAYIVSLDSAGNMSAPSPTVYVIVAQLIKPTNFTAVATGPTSVLLTWSGAQGTAYKYNITRFTDSLNGAQTVYTILMPATSYIDTNATPGTTYIYQIASADTLGYTSQRATSASITTPSASVTVPITVTSPNGGETWQYNLNYRLGYVLNGVSADRIGVKLLKGSEVAYNTITSTTWGDGIFHISLSGVNLYSSVGSGTNYKIRIYNQDNPGVYDDSDNYFTILPTDITPPVISSLSASSITSNSAVITWTTDEPAIGSVNYGSNPWNWVVTPDDITLLTSHSFVLTNLTSTTTYFYRVNSRDSSGNSIQGLPSVHTFTTLTAPSSNLRLKNLMALSRTLESLKILMDKLLDFLK